MKITLIGLGKMGTVLAEKLLESHFDLTVYNRTLEKIQPLLELGAKGASSIIEAVHGADIMISCLLDDSSLLNMEDSKEFWASLKSGIIHMNTSTILPETAKYLSEQHRTHGSHYIAAPILGIPKVVKLGKASTFVAGNSEALDLCLPLLNTYACKVINVGSEAYQANVMKICANYLLAANIEAMGEIYTFAEKSNLDVNMIDDFFHSVFAHPAFSQYSDKIRARNFEEVNFDLKGGFKDLNLFQKAFTDMGVVPDLANVVKSKLKIALAKGLDKKDWSAFTQIIREQAGLEEL